MRILTRDDLQTVYQDREGICVSIYMSTHPGTTEPDYGPNLLENLLAKARKHLLAAGLCLSDTNKLLEPAQRLICDKRFWRYQGEGLALFLSEETFYHYRLPCNFEAQVVIAGRFHIKPLLPLLADDGQFFILALSQNQVRLLQGTRHSAREVDIAGIPANLTSTMVVDGPKKQLQFHTKPEATGSKRWTAISHGYNGIDKQSRINIRRYFRQINNELFIWLANEHAPLLLAGADHLLTLYNEVNSYPHLLDEVILGNPEKLQADELQQRGWAIVQPLFQRARRQARVQYQQLTRICSEQVANDPMQIIQAALNGRVETLFVALGQRLWGRFDPETGAVKLHHEKGGGDCDLLNIAVIQTMMSGGAIYAVPLEEMPSRNLLAAVFRY